LSTISAHRDQGGTAEDEAIEDYVVAQQGGEARSRDAGFIPTLVVHENALSILIENHQTLI